jgi:hypothetical protein
MGFIVRFSVSGTSQHNQFSASGRHLAKVGEIPGYALFPDGRPGPTSVFFKALR